MPEYKCECCQFKTIIKPHFEKHNASNKHLKRMEGYTPGALPSVVEPTDVRTSSLPPFSCLLEKALEEKIERLESIILSLVNNVDCLVNKVDCLEQTIKEFKQNNAFPVVAPVVAPQGHAPETPCGRVPTPVVAPVIAPATEIDVYINDLFSKVLDLDPYTNKRDGLPDSVDWDNVVKDHISPSFQSKMSKDDAVYVELTDAYQEDSVSSIVNSFRKKVPKELIKISDISRGKFSVYNGEWLNKAESEDKIMEFIKLSQQRLNQLHHIWMTCCEQKDDLDMDLYMNRMLKVNEGAEVHPKILKKILEWYL